MRNRLPLLVGLIAACGISAGVLGATIRSEREELPYGRFDNARTVHVTPEGRLIIAYLGTGAGDGRVVAVSRGQPQDVLMAGLPSSRNSGQAHSDLAGPSGAAMASDGTVCAVIGDGPTVDFATMRCSDGLVVDLKAFERANNPDGRSVESNPYDIAWDGISGWIVADAAANTLLAVSRTGEISVLAVFWPAESGQPEGVPTGLDAAPFADRFRHVGFGLFAGGTGIFDVGRSGPLPRQPEGRPVVAVALNQFAVSSSELSLCWLEWDSVQEGGDLICDGEFVREFDRPTGLARVSPHELVVIAGGRLVRVELESRDLVR